MIGPELKRTVESHRNEVKSTPRRKLVEQMAALSKEASQLSRRDL